MNVTVYSLSSTRDGDVRYIGQTTQPLVNRMRQHRSYAKTRRSTPIHKWIMREEEAGYTITMTAIAEGAILHKSEIEQIAAFRKAGCKLLNLTDGGEGTVGWSGNAGNKRPDLADRNRAQKGQPGHPSTPEANAKISAANKGKTKPWLADRNRSMAGKPGHPHTDASRAAISAKLKGRVFTPEWRAKLSAAALARKGAAHGV